MMSGENSHVGCWSPDHTSFLLLAQKKGANLSAGREKDGRPDSNRV